MQSVVRFSITVGILVLLFIWVSGCGLNIFSSNGERYQIQVIQSVPLQEYLERFGESGDLGIPTEIQLTQMPSDHFYKGRVKLSIAGWKNIESPSRLDDGEKSFDVSTGLDSINLWFYQYRSHAKTRRREENQGVRSDVLSWGNFSARQHYAAFGDAPI